MAADVRMGRTFVYTTKEKWYCTISYGFQKVNVGGEGPTVPSQPLDRVKHTCPVSAAVGVDRRSSEDPTEATGVLLCNGDYLKK